MNRIITSIILIIILPFLILIASIILIIDRRPIIFVQERIGKKKKIFKIYKFRTMDNNKITALGKFLRRTGIDEIPQLINILIGDMNFIGPRPLTKQDVIRLEWNTNFHDIRWDIKPGITGLSQLSPICNKRASFFLDKFYINNHSVILHGKIIFTSVLILFLGKRKGQKLFFKR